MLPKFEIEFIKFEIEFILGFWESGLISGYPTRKIIAANIIWLHNVIRDFLVKNTNASSASQRAAKCL